MTFYAYVPVFPPPKSLDNLWCLRFLCGSDNSRFRCNPSNHMAEAGIKTIAGLFTRNFLLPVSLFLLFISLLTAANHFDRFSLSFQSSTIFHLFHKYGSFFTQSETTAAPRYIAVPAHQLIQVKNIIPFVILNYTYFITCFKNSSLLIITGVTWLKVSHVYSIISTQMNFVFWIFQCQIRTFVSLLV